MVAKTTSAETASGALAGPEEFRIALSGNNYKVTATQIKTWASDAPTLVSPAITSAATMDMVAARTIAMQSFAASARFYAHDRFNYATLTGVDAYWVRRFGTDPQAVMALGTSYGGGIVLTSGDDVAASMAVNGAQLSGPPSVRAGAAGASKVTFAFQIFVGDITNVCMFCGLSDQNAALEMPFTLAAADALTSNATDAVGVLFDTNAATDNWWLVGVKTDVDATKQNTGAPPPGRMTNLHSRQPPKTFASWRCSRSAHASRLKLDESNNGEPLRCRGAATERPATALPNTELFNKIRQNRSFAAPV